MIRLYYFPGNASLAPHMLLREVGAEFELALVDRTKNGQKDPEYMRLNPNGRIPTLVDNDLVIYEAAAICLHIADRFPKANLAPELGSAARAHFYKWLMYLTNTVQAELMVFFYPEKHVFEKAAEAAVKEGAMRRVTAMFEQLNETLSGAGPYLLGDRLSAADFYLAMLCRWGRVLPKPPRDMPALARHFGLITSRSAVRAAFEAEKLAEPWF